MKMSEEKTTSVVLICIIVFTTLFIFFNSGMDYVSSHNASGEVVDIITDQQGENREVVEIIIRKSAHMIEFALLGMSVYALTHWLKKAKGKHLFGYAIFYCLFVGVVDEFIQSFSDRTSSTGDIILDFIGGLIGFALCFVVIKVLSAIRNKNYK